MTSFVDSRLRLLLKGWSTIWLLILCQQRQHRKDVVLRAVAAKGLDVLLAHERSDDAALLLCAELNETQTVFPQTDLRMIFEVGITKTPVNLPSVNPVENIAKS